MAGPADQWGDIANRFLLTDSGGSLMFLRCVDRLFARSASPALYRSLQGFWLRCRLTQQFKKEPAFSYREGKNGARRNRGAPGSRRIG
jgi:hypothetical protein